MNDDPIIIKVSDSVKIARNCEENCKHYCYNKKLEKVNKFPHLCASKGDNNLIPIPKKRKDFSNCPDCEPKNPTIIYPWPTPYSREKIRKALKSLHLILGV